MSSRSNKKSISQTGRSSPERPSSFPVKVPAWLLLTLLLISVSALFLPLLLRSRVYLIGDGREYACSAVLWGEDFRPFHPESAVRSCILSLLPGDPHGPVGWTEVKGTVESIHFWVLPLLVSPFVPLARILGLTPLHAWPLFHWALSLFGLWWICRRAGPWFSAGILVVLASSPLLFWSNKAHSEFYVCSMLLLGFVALWKGRLLEATLWISLASLQQTTLAVPALVCFGAWVLFHSRLPREEPKWLIAAIVAVQALQPLYYMSRVGHPSMPVLSDGFRSDMFSVHRAMSLLFDPDIGILQAWPQGIVFCVFVAVVLAVGRDRSLARVAAGALAFILIEPLIICMQQAWNSGGTVFIQRYGLYLMTAMTVAGVAAAASLKHRPVQITVGIAGLFLVFAGLQYRTWPIFYPSQPENYMARSDFARWLYANHPEWYDPEPEIFVERIISRS